MIKTSVSLGDLSSMGYKSAKQHIQNTIKDSLLQSALIFNLHPETA